MSPHNPITHGPLDRAILRLAVPEIASQLLRWAFLTADTYFVGHSEGPQLAALSSASFVYWALQALGILLSIGVTALVARRWGENDHEKAKEVASQGVLWVLPYGLLCSLLLWVGAGPLLSLIAASPESAKGGATFLYIIGLGAPLMYLGYVVDAVFKGSGDTRTPLVLLTISVLLNIVLDAILILGFSLGIAGAAIATASSQAFAALAGLFLLRRRGRVELRGVRFSVQTFLQICKIGSPLALSSLLFSSIYIAIAALLKPFGDAAQAGLAIGHRVESLNYLVAVGFGSAATTLVGQCLGARDPVRASRAAWRCVLYASSVALFSTVVMFLLPSTLSDIFSDDPKVIEAGALYVLLISISQLGTALEIVTEGGFGGAGDTIPPMAINILFTAARIPLGALFAYSLLWGYEGIYWAITWTGLARGIVMAVWFARGKWKTRVV